MKRIIFLIAAILIFPVAVTKAELLSSPQFNYSIDFPEGFSMTDGTEDGKSYLFSHKLLPVQAFIRIWKNDIFKDSKSAAGGTLAKLNAKTDDISEFMWRNQKVSLSKFTMTNAAYPKPQSGWCLSTPLPGKDCFLVLASYADSDKSFDCEQFILSLLDSLMIDAGSFKEPGAITTFAYPRNKKKNISLSIGGKKIATSIDESDKDASQFVIDREFEVFKLFTATTLWKEAWQRFYRIIAKDSFLRLKKVSFDIYSALISDARLKDMEMPEAAVAQMLLNWVQEFQYKRVSSQAIKADINPLTSILEGEGSDCDGRSLLCAVLLKQMNVNTCIFVSREYSHAILGVELKGKQGQTITIDETNYLVGETTAKGITLGMIQSTMQDRSKWIPVEFY